LKNVFNFRLILSPLQSARLLPDRLHEKLSPGLMKYFLLIVTVMGIQAAGLAGWLFSGSKKAHNLKKPCPESAYSLTTLSNKSNYLIEF